MLCEPNPCQNGGQCSYIGGPDVTSEITCNCIGNYVGDKCQYESKLFYFSNHILDHKTNSVQWSMK